MKNRKELVTEYKGRIVTGGVYAIKNTINEKILLLSATDLYGCKNRFEFSKKVNTCTYIRLQQDWNQYGSNSFIFEILDELEKKDNQTVEEFKEDIKILFEIWREKFNSEKLY